jgi:hypothetical protein
VDPGRGLRVKSFNIQELYDCTKCITLGRQDKRCTRKENYFVLRERKRHRVPVVLHANCTKKGKEEKRYTCVAFEKLALG